ncbi:MAG: UbiA prenyltransferase family protein [Ferruginibacter sp.]|nr:UbiA prenyltransferase family protein [Ferruginibacter sp.]
MLIHSALFLISIVIPVVSLFFRPVLTKEILRDLRFLRILHYVILAILGFSIYLSGKGIQLNFFQQHQLLVFLLYIIALIYAAVFAIVTNNIADIETDKISNTTRPLVKGTVNSTIYLSAGIFCLIYSLAVSYVINSLVFFCILLISAVYFVYSCKPFRLKRIPVIAKLLIGFNSLAVAVCGFVLAGGRLNDFPVIWAVFITVPLALAANFIDLKDTAGDSKTGIKTLPVIFGERKAIHFIAFFTACTYVMAAAIIDLLWVYPLCGIMAFLHIALLYREPFNEKPVFLIYISALFGLNIILLFNKYLS